MKDLVELALAARTVDDVSALETALRSAGAIRERYLGDNDVNFSALSTSADPRVLIFERVTNAFDAMVERRIREEGIDPSALRSPLQAAQALSGMPRSGNMADLDPATRLRRAAEIIVSLLDSDSPRSRPTISIRDFGIGIARDEAPHTILSLEGNNKLEKFYAHGVFGKGGSLACEYSDATVIVMRKQPEFLLANQEDLVTIVVVRTNDRPDVKLAYHRYLVAEAPGVPKGLPIAVPAREVDFPAGVYVSHINYEAKRMGEFGWRQEASVATFADTVLFRPTLPYTIRDARSGKANVRPAHRRDGTFAGLGARLDKKIVEPIDEDNDTTSAVIDRGGVPTYAVPGLGTIKVRWSLFSSRDRRRSYVAPGYVVVFTHDGQVHHAWSQQRFIDKVGMGLRLVAERLFVEVDTSGIPVKQSHRIFSSFRNEIRDTRESAQLEQAVANWLKNDGDLQDAQSKLQRDVLRQSTQRLSAELVERLNKAISAKLPIIGFNSNGSAPQRTPRPKKKPIEVLGLEPTYLDGPDTLSLLPGETVHFYLTTNAIDGFVPDRAEPTLEVDGAGLFLSSGYLSGGRLQAELQATHAATIGSRHGTVRLQFLARSGGLKTVEHPMRINIVAERPAAPVPKPPTNGAGSNQSGKPQSYFAFRWVEKPEEEPGWDANTAGDLQMIAGKDLAESNPSLYGHLSDFQAEVPTISLNQRWPVWDRYRHQIASNDVIVQQREEEYMVALSVVIADLWVAEDQRKRAETTDTPPEDRAMTDKQRRRAIAFAARGVVAMLPQIDKVFAQVS